MVVTPPAWLVIAVSRDRVITEYPAAVSAAVWTRFGIGVGANKVGGSVTGAAPSWPVCVTEASHSDGDVVGSPVAGEASAWAQVSTFWRELPVWDCVLMPVSASSVQNVGAVTEHGAAAAQARSSGASCRVLLAVKVTCAAGILP